MILTPAIEERFSSEVKKAYQVSKSKFESLVTVRPVDAGDTTYFNKAIAGGEAQAKAVFGKIPDIGGGIGRVKCELTDFYAKAEIDNQDVSKTTVNGTLIMSDNVKAAIERKKDRVILTAMSAASQEIAHNSEGMTIDKVEEIWQTFSDNLLFENGEYPIVMVGTKQFQDLMNIDSFSKAETVGYQDMPYLETKAVSGRKWYDMTFIVNPKLDKTGDIRTCYAFVPSAVGLAMTPSVTKSVAFEDNDTDTVKHWAKFKAGAIIIDDLGIIKIGCSEAAVSS
jgi:hypothetical protein